MLSVDAQVGEKAFENCKGLERINIPQSVKMIGRNSFVGCVSIAEVVLKGDGTLGQGIYSDYMFY